ncbi:hypothetical protein [Streptosporangium roseum]|uniref:hypothetical protein n=1 Tax=Streptosporangium roseum TaxID=2001 RepID=UPI003330C9FC
MTDAEATETPREGRPTLLTPELAKILCDAREKGNSITDCAAHAGIARGTLHRWLQEGEADDSPPEFRDFRDRFTRARAMAIGPLLNAAYEDAIGGKEIKRATRPDGTEEVQFTPPNGKIALELMARMDPENWLPRKAVELSGPEGAAIPLSMQHQQAIETGLAKRIAEVKAKRAERAALKAEQGEE